MSAPFFSVVIPTLNEEKYLPILLQSLVKQTLRDFEVIVVDGGSKDKTSEVFDKYKRQIPEAQILTSDRANVGYQRNLGGKKARGEYLIFFDADVKMEPTFLEELHLAIMKKKFLFATTWMVPDSHKSQDALLVTMGNLGQELAKALDKPIAGGLNTIIKRSTFLKLKGFLENTKINEDHEFAIRANKNKINLTILKDPHVVVSLRRFRSEGILPVLRKYAQVQYYNFTQSPFQSAFFDYQMGGHVHKMKRKKINWTKLNTYLRAIRRLEDKINRFLLE